MNRERRSTDPDRTGPSITVHTPATTRRGREIDLPGGAVDPGRLVAAIGNDLSVDTATGDSEPPIGVDCPDPGPAHERVGHVHADVSVRVPTALAAAARSRGLTAPQDERRRRLRDRLDAMPVPAAPDTTDLRRTLADLDARIERLRERAATVRGRVQERREAGEAVDDLRTTLTETVADLSERETERVAARERLDRARERAREVRAVRDRRRRLDERAANLEREARAHLVERIRPEFERCVATAPGGPPGRAVDHVADVDPVTAALAVARVAAVRAPVVLDCGRFPDAAAASDWLDAPVVRIRSSES